MIGSETIIEVPKNFCELDNREACTEGKCIRYDPKKFASTPTMVTYFPGGRMGNMLTAFLMLLWLKLEFGFDVYYEKSSLMVRKCFYLFSQIFSSVLKMLASCPTFSTSSSSTF